MDGRTVYLDSEKLKKQRIARGWRVEDLARVAVVSERSVRNAESGQKVHVSTYAKIAKALGAKAGDLLRELENPVKPSNVRVQIVVEADMKEFANSPHLIQLVALLAKMIPATTDIQLIDVKPGSIILDLEMSQDDALHLVALLPEFQEHVCEAIAETPEGKAYFSETNPDNLDLSNIVVLLELALSVTEMRIMTGPTLSDDEQIEDDEDTGLRRKKRSKKRKKKMETLKRRLAKAKAQIERKRQKSHKT